MEKPIVPNHLEIGKQAELTACHWLQGQGLCLITQNYRCFSGEIDLIMQDASEIVFIEVRYRSRADFGSAIESVNAYKQHKLIKAATHFLQRKKWLYQVNSRFDIVAIHPSATEWQLNWVKNAFSINERSGL